MCAYIFINVDGFEVTFAQQTLYEQNIAYFTAIILLLLEIIINAYIMLGMFSCDCIFYRVKNYSSPRAIFISPEITPRVIPESPSSVWQRFSAIFTVGSFFFFLSTALYSIYAQRATTIKLLLRRCDTRSAAILVVYYYIAIIGIYRLSDRSHSTPLRPIAPLYYVPPSSLPNIPDLHVLQSRFFSFYPSLKFNDIYGYEF